MALKTLEIIKKGNCTYGHLDGFLYSASDSKGDVKYWKCIEKEVHVEHDFQLYQRDETF